MKRLFLRILAVSLLLIVLLAGFLTVVLPPWQEVMIERSKYSQSLQRIARQSTIDKRAADYQALLESNPPDLIDSHIYKSATTASAETAFQKDLNELAQKAGLILNSTNGQVARPSGGFTQLRIRIDASANTKQLAGFLGALRNHRKIMVVSKASIRVRRPESDSGPAELALNLEIVSYGRV